MPLRVAAPGSERRHGVHPVFAAAPLIILAPLTGCETATWLSRDPIRVGRYVVVGRNCRRVFVFYARAGTPAQSVWFRTGPRGTSASTATLTVVRNPASGPAPSAGGVPTLSGVLVWRGLGVIVLQE